MMKKIISFLAVAVMLVIWATACREARNQEVQNREAQNKEAQNEAQNPGTQNQEVQNRETPGKKPTADRHKDRGVKCGACHDGEAEPKTAASSESCLTCKNHGSWDIVAERASLDKGYKVNPHRNHISEAYDLECTLCHRPHEADAIACHSCHQGLEFK